MRICWEIFSKIEPFAVDEFAAEFIFTEIIHYSLFRLCVTSSSVMFFPVGSGNSVEFPHACIRGCANNDRHFKLETGRNSPTGSGSLVIDCDDRDVTHHLHETMLRAMQNSQSREQYLPNRHPSRNRSQSLSEAQRHQNQNFPPKSLPRAVERNRTISEPPDKPGQVTPEPGLPPKRPMSMRYTGSYSTSPNIKSPISPVGSMSTGISSDGTGSSNSINDPYMSNGDHDMVNYSNQPDVIPEESSGEISIEFNIPKTTDSQNNTVSINQTLPRVSQTGHGKYVHQKQASLTEFTMDPDYMDMTPGSKTTSYPGPPLPRRNNTDHGPLSSSPRVSETVTSSLSSVQSPGSDLSSEYHVMQPRAVTTGDQGLYFEMDRLSTSDTHLTTSTPLKSTSTTTLVNTTDTSTLSSSSPTHKTPPVDILRPQTVPDVEGAAALTPSTVLTPPDSVTKTRIPSGDGGYVVMSPGVSHNMSEGLGMVHEDSHCSLAVLEESLGGQWRSSPRHASPSFTKERSRPDSKRNSSCYDDSEAHWDSWRYVDDPGTGPDDNYAMVYYPGRSASRPTPHSRLSPSSSSSAMSGTPSRDSDFHDRLTQISSYIRDDDDDRLATRPPAANNRRSLTATTPRHIPPSSSNSSRSNISPFGKTPPSLLAGSPTVSRKKNFTRNYLRY